MNRKWIFPTLTCTALGFALTFVIVSRPQPSPATPPANPPTAAEPAPGTNLIGATGLIEPQSEVIQLSCPVSGLVTSVTAFSGSVVKAGDPLFQIDSRDLEAQLLVKRAAVGSAQAKLDRLLAQPRPEELPAFAALVDSAKATMDNAISREENVQKLVDKRAVTVEDANERHHTMEAAKAQYAKALADYNLEKAGAWKPDIEQARADLAQAQADVEQTQRLIDRLTVRAPADGTVIQSQVRLGQYANAASTDPLMLFAAGKAFHIRVQVDENDSWRIRPNTSAYAYVRGNTADRFNLRFVRFEPYVIPKKSLTGDTTERVDTRVLEVIYEIDRQDQNIFFGQQMDVFIETPVTSPIRQPR
jgi:multidrug resistance efflux pump